MKTLNLIAYALPLEREPLATPIIVASITTDARFARLDVKRELGILAGKLGLMDWDVGEGTGPDMPHQLVLPLEVRRGR